LAARFVIGRPVRGWTVGQIGSDSNQEPKDRVRRYTPTKFEIELFRLGKDPHHQERFARRRRLPLPDLQIEAVIPTAEDVVIQKLRWQRDKDLADVRIVMAVQAARLDWSYVQQWTDQHGTTELLNRLKSQLGI
jgi:hypothetical protein